MTRIQTVIDFLAKWIARIILTALAYAGMVWLLGGVDPLIAYFVSGVVVVYLLKETL